MMENSETAEAVGKIPSGIFLVTAKQNKKEAALLASWVQQVSFSPLRVSIAVNKDRPIALFLEDGARFGVHVLGKNQKILYQHFVRPKSDQSPFQGLKVEYNKEDVPILKEALAVMMCQVASRIDAGDHHLILADVLDGGVTYKGEPWVHIRKSGLNY